MNKQRIIIVLVFIILIILGGLAYWQYSQKPVIKNENTSIDNVNNNIEESGLTYNYTPSNWVIENGIFYSPEMYDMREGGLYSLSINIDNNFSSLVEYLKDKEDCIDNKNILQINGNQSVQFINICNYAKPKVIVMQMDGRLISATSYAVSDESVEIIKILESIKLK